MLGLEINQNLFEYMVTEYRLNAYRSYGKVCKRMIQSGGVRRWTCQIDDLDLRPKSGSFKEEQLKSGDKVIQS